MAPRPAPQLVIAVAEDDDELRAVLVEIFSRRGWRVVELEDTSELDDFFDFVLRHGAPRGLPDVVVTDMRMPGGNGVDALVRARARGVRCPFLVLSAFPSDELQARVAALEDAVLVGKPARTRELVDALERLTARRRAPGEG